MEDIILHVDCNGDALRIAQDKLDCKNFYACNPSFDKNCPAQSGGCGCK